MQFLKSFYAKMVRFSAKLFCALFYKGSDLENWLGNFDHFIPGQRYLEISQIKKILPALRSNFFKSTMASNARKSLVINLHSFAQNVVQNRIKHA